MKRVPVGKTPENLGKKIRVCGWVNSRRDHGGIVFLDLRDNSGVLQVVCAPESVEDVREEYVLDIEGEVKERPKSMVNPELKTGKVELKAKTVKILSEAKVLPFDLKQLDLKLPTLLDYRPVTLRNEKVKAIFKIQEVLLASFRKTMRERGFTEFQAPSIVPVATEGGAEVFHIDYFEYDAYLAQSPQLYKQIMVGVFEKVFAISHAYRAEPSMTTRHLTEYISLDGEMGFIDSWEEIMDVCEVMVKNILLDIKEKCEPELKLFKAKIPNLDQKFPRIKLREAQEIIFKRTGRDNRKEPDLEPEDEKEICRWAKEEKGSDLLFITHYPTEKRPFYTFPDPEDPEYTLSFDLLYRGLEIVTGGQRIHQYKKLVENIKKWGLKKDNFAFYLKAFKYGMPPEGGFGSGAERIVQQALGLKSIKEASLFPRDMGRIDQRLAILQPPEEKKD